MPVTDPRPILSRETVLRFLEYTPPFNELPDETLAHMAEVCTVEFYPKEEVVLERGKTPVRFLRLIYDGRMRLTLRDEEGIIKLEDFRSVGETVGALGILRQSLSNLDVAADQDTICILINHDEFLSLISSHTSFARFFIKALTEGYVDKALSQLERRAPRETTEGTLALFNAQVGDVVRTRPVTAPGDMSVQQAAQLMSERRVGSLLITDQYGREEGVVTDRDLRTKVVAAGRELSLPVREVMSSPIATIGAQTYCFDALLEMMKQRVHHLGVEKNGEIVSMLSGHDLMVLQGSSPLTLVREITTATTIESLYDLSLKSPRVVRSLIYEGAKAGNVTRMITMINDYILDRLLTLMVRRMGDPPLPFCWMLMGSEGRKEQTFRTDQDNGLLYADPENPAQAKAAREYFMAFGLETIEHLVACGFPRCNGGIMASNETWNQPYSVWRGYFDRWITSPQPQEVLNATIFFDFRSGWGELELGDRLRRHLMETVKGQEIFLRFLAKDTLTTPSALSLFRNFITEKDGEYKNRLDLKHKGLVPFVDFGRLMSLRSGVSETNTLERLQALGDGGHISHEMQQKTMQAYEFLMQLRLMHQQYQHEQGLEPDNFLDPHELSELERRTLKDSLGVIGDIKSFLKEEFRLGG